jgi:hypothetical protein
MVPASERAQKVPWRRERDSNPRKTLLPSTVFKFYVVRVIQSVWCYLVQSCPGFRDIWSVWRCPVLSCFVYNVSTTACLPNLPHDLAMTYIYCNCPIIRSYFDS